MPYLVIFAVGLLFLGIGFLSNWLLTKSAQGLADEAPTESGGQMRDRTTGIALFYSWVSIAIGAALILLTIFLYVEGVFE